MRSPRLLASLSIAGVVLVLTLPVSAESGDHDSTFGQAGTAWAPFRACDCGGNASMRTQPDGKTVVLGATHLARLLRNGALDPSFGTGGVVALNLGQGVPDGLGIDHAGRVLVVGHLTVASLVEVRRWSPQGVPDATLARSTDFSLFHQPFHVVGIAEQVVGSARRYVIGGSTPTGAFAALGVQENGRPDPTFGVAGRATNESTTDLDPDIAIARGFAIEPGNGRIVVAGQVGQSGGDIGGNPLVARFTPNGVPDVRFGLAGVTGATINYGEEAPGVGVTVAPGGAIYVTGSFEYYKTGTDEDFVLWRFQPDGSVDRSFGGYGYLLLDNGGTSPDPALPANRQWVIGDFAQTVVVQPDGKPIVSGARFVVGCSTGCPHTFFYRAEAVRLLHNGKPDPSFGTNGWVTGPAGDGRALALQGNRVLIGGDLSDQPPLGTHYVSQPPPPGMRLGLRVTQFAR